MLALATLVLEGKVTAADQLTAPGLGGGGSASSGVALSECMDMEMLEDCDTEDLPELAATLCESLISRGARLQRVEA